MTIWMDMTNSMVTWQGGVVDIIRAELEIAKNLHKIDKDIRFTYAKNGGFHEIPVDSLDWLWKSENVADSYIEKMGRNKKTQVQEINYDEFPKLKNAMVASSSKLERAKIATVMLLDAMPWVVRIIAKPGMKIGYKILRKIQQRKNDIVEVSKFTYPFSEGDVFFSCGWIDSGKESIISNIKNELDIKVCYLIYDIIIVKNGFKQYYCGMQEMFDDYLEWVALNSDFILYGGHNAQIDTESYLCNKGFMPPIGNYIKFGSQIGKKNSLKSCKDILNKMNIDEKFIIVVGNVEHIKNYKTIYRAYMYMLSRYKIDDIPKLIIVGGVFNIKDLYTVINTTPIIKEKIQFLSPSDEELYALYQMCEFAILPSLYEGWSYTFTEILNYSKACICADVPPLREIGNNIAIFVNPLNHKAWADNIMELYINKEKRIDLENKVKDEWLNTTWYDCALMIKDNIKNNLSINNNEHKNSNILYYDVSLIMYAILNSLHASGILRTQLILARVCSRKFKRIKFIYFNEDGMYILPKDIIRNILGNLPIDVALKKDRIEFLNRINNVNNSSIKDKLKYRYENIFWMYCTIIPSSYQKKIIKFIKSIYNNESNLNNDDKVYKTCLFEDGDIIFSTGTGYTDTTYKRLKDKIYPAKFIQLIYDYTPIIVPQTHLEETVKWYEILLKNTDKLADIIFYGGKTAQNDGRKYQIEHGYNVKPSYAMKFGSDIMARDISEKRSMEILSELGIDREFILIVGSIERRKNHEILYDAYINLLEKEEKNLPILVICGYPGWKTGDFLNVLHNDDRVKGHIILGSFSDEQLYVLYQECLFTVLPSLYEGWSLTLPESLNKGKFCIASKVAPLQETGEDFIDYADPYDADEWAEKIMYYVNNRDVLREKEQYIKDKWHSITWDECADNTLAVIREIMNGDMSSLEQE